MGHRLQLLKQSRQCSRSIACLRLDVAHVIVSVRLEGAIKIASAPCMISGERSKYRSLEAASRQRPEMAESAISTEGRFVCQCR